jgi:hypothetical protein
MRIHVKFKKKGGEIMKLKYEYDSDDESKFYNIDRNPNNTNEINGLLLLEKYDYNLIDSKIEERDIIEMGRIISRLYEDSLSFMESDLTDYIHALISIRYCKQFKDHIIYYVSHAERLRSKFIVRLRQINGIDIAKEYIYSNILSKENISESFNRLYGNYLGTGNDKKNDLYEFINNDILDENWFREFVLKHTEGFDDNTLFIIKDLIIGGYYHEYM